MLCPRVPGVFSPVTRRGMTGPGGFPVTGKSFAWSPTPRVASRADKTESSSPDNAQWETKGQKYDDWLSKCFTLQIAISLLTSWKSILSNINQWFWWSNALLENDSFPHCYCPKFCFYAAALIQVLQCGHLILPRVQKCSHRRNSGSVSPRLAPAHCLDTLVRASGVNPVMTSRGEGKCFHNIIVFS